MVVAMMTGPRVTGTTRTRRHHDTPLLVFLPFTKREHEAEPHIARPCTAGDAYAGSADCLMILTIALAGCADDNGPNDAPSSVTWLVAW